VALQREYDQAVEEQQLLEEKEKSCKTQLENADKLIGGLGE
jgi:hypothetical protein